MKLTHRSNLKELLDEEGIPFADIRQNMQELNTINSLLGGHAITLKGVQALLDNRKSLHICEIGCGGGDNLAVIAQWCIKNGIRIQCTGIDNKASCIEVASNRKSLQGIANWQVCDYAEAVFESPPDIIFSSLFCHHFTHTQLVKQMVWMQRNCQWGFFINDLQRHVLAYRSIQLLTKVFSRSYLVKHDAPLSVARGFIKKEWTEIFKEARLSNVAIQWKWAFRYLIVWKKIK